MLRPPSARAGFDSRDDTENLNYDVLETQIGLDPEVKWYRGFNILNFTSTVEKVFSLLLSF